MTIQIKMEWKNPTFTDTIAFAGPLPVTIGRLGSKADVELDSSYISTEHARLEWDGKQVVLVDLGSRNGTAVNQTPITAPTPISDTDTIQIGPFTAKLAFEGNSQTKPQQSHVWLTNAFTNPIVILSELGSEFETTTYLAIGGGIGSFTWVDHLRIFGVKADEIVSIGFENKPYGRYQRLCANSQIPDHERLRSNSDSCPDNIWGWPGYGVREMWQETVRGRLDKAAKVGWKLFNEPLVETYTPKSGDVYASMDREAERIGWEHIFRCGRVRMIRKTDDGRYLVAYTHMPEDGPKQHRLIVANYVHLAVGYPGVRFLPDLQAYRDKTGDFTRVVNAYENHEHLYDSLRNKGGVVLVRGRGIVASRIIQRIYELRQETKQPIRVLHLMRSPNENGNQHGKAQRKVSNHWEHQPFNWPKAAWGGDLRPKLAEGSTQTQMQLYSQWGGTTTADRVDWRNMVIKGLHEGWYEIKFGKVEQVTLEDNGRLALLLLTKNNTRTMRFYTDFIIDATGLDSSVQSNALLSDLLSVYELPLNYQGRFDVNEKFELETMRNGNGRIYASGIITLGGHYAPVDSFLGLQYAALKSVDDLTKQNALGLRRINGTRSVSQWTRWALGVNP